MAFWRGWLFLLSAKYYQISFSCHAIQAGVASLIRKCAYLVPLAVELNWKLLGYCCSKTSLCIVLTLSAENRQFSVRHQSHQVQLDAVLEVLVEAVASCCTKMRSRI